MALRLKRGTNAERLNYTPELGELIYVTDYQSAGVSPLWIGDGSTIGGNEASSTGTGITDIVNDTTPELGGNLNLNNFDVIGIGDLDIDGSIDITGSLTATTALIGDISGDLTGSIFLDDSSRILDGTSGEVYLTDIWAKNNEILIKNDTANTSNSLTISSDNQRSNIKLVHFSELDLTGVIDNQYGSIIFARDDINGYLQTGVIFGRENSIYIGNSSDGDLTTIDKYIVWKDQKLGIKKSIPTKELDVEGDAEISGSLTAGAMFFTGSNVDTTDSSAITVTPSSIFASDVTVENNLTVTNKITVDTLEVQNLITAGSGTPELDSETEILLTAGTRVEVTQSPFKLASFTTAERDALTAQNGDMIYNSTTDKVQAYAAGAWVDLH